MTRRGFLVLALFFLILVSILANAQLIIKSEPQIQTIYPTESEEPTLSVETTTSEQTIILEESPTIIIKQQTVQQETQQPAIEEVHTTVKTAVQTFIEQEENPILQEPSLIIEAPLQKGTAQISLTERIILEAEPQIKETLTTPKSKPKKVRKKVTEYQFTKEPEKPVKTAKIKVKTQTKNNKQVLSSVHIDLGN